MDSYYRGWLFGIITMCLLDILFMHNMHRSRAIETIREDAVKNGVATYFVNTAGEKVFAWKKLDTEQNSDTISVK